MFLDQHDAQMLTASFLRPTCKLVESWLRCSTGLVQLPPLPRRATEAAPLSQLWHAADNPRVYAHAKPVAAMLRGHFLSPLYAAPRVNQLNHMSNMKHYWC